MTKQQRLSPPPDKNEDPWKPYRGATPDERRGWLRMPSGKAPDEVERWAEENGYVLKWVNIADDETAKQATQPKMGPPWAPVHMQDPDSVPFHGRPGTDGHNSGTVIRYGNELQLMCMPKDLYDSMQNAIQEETDELSMGLGSQYEQDVERLGGAPTGSLYEPAKTKPDNR